MNSPQSPNPNSPGAYKAPPPPSGATGPSAGSAAREPTRAGTKVTLALASVVAVVAGWWGFVSTQAPPQREADLVPMPVDSAASQVAVAQPLPTLAPLPTVAALARVNPTSVAPQPAVQPAAPAAVPTATPTAVPTLPAVQAQPVQPAQPRANAGGFSSVRPFARSRSSR